jgi:hypothetical protein
LMLRGTVRTDAGGSKVTIVPSWARAFRVSKRNDAAQRRVMRFGLNDRNGVKRVRRFAIRWRS